MIERSWWQVFRAPLALGIATTIGLVCGLCGEHLAWRALTWSALTAPVVVIVRAIAKKHQSACRVRPRATTGSRERATL